jgi:hypothetical protein
MCKHAMSLEVSLNWNMTSPAINALNFVEPPFAAGNFQILEA